MKTNTFIAFSVLILVVVYSLVMRIQPDMYGDMARFIPGNALVYFEQHDGTDWVKRIATSPLGMKIKTVDFVATAKKIGWSDKMVRNLEQLVAGVNGVQEKGLISKIFGEQMAIALMPPLDTHHEKKNFVEYLRANIVLVTQPKHNAELLDLIGTKYGEHMENITITSNQYGNHRIKRIVAGNETISIVTIDGFFIMSFNERQLRRSIDTFDSRVSALSQSNEFLLQKKNFKKPTRFIYIPVANVREFLIDIAVESDFSNRELWLKELQTTVGFTSFGYGAWQKRQRVDDKVVIQYDAASINTLVENHLNTPPSQCNMLSLTSEKPMMYYWSNAFNFNHFLLYLKDVENSGSRYDSFLQRIEAVAGVTIEDFFSLLGKEVSFVMERGSGNTMFPIPLGVIFIEINEVERFKTILENLIAHSEIPMIRRKYGQVAYFYWAHSSQDGLQPLYGFWHQYLFIANSSSLLRKVIDRNVAGKDLLDYPVMKRLDPGLNLDNNSVTYTNNIDLLHVVKQTLNLFTTAVAVKDRENASKMHIIIETIISPLLKGAEMYDTSVTRSFFTRDKIIIETRTRITH